MKKKRIHRILQVCYATIIGSILLFSVCVWGYYLIIHWQETEPYTKETETTVEQLHSIEGLKASLISYPFLQKSLDDYGSYIENGTYVIPGLNAARSMRAGTDEVCTNMVPQSICLTESYLLIGAYCKTGKHYSVIYVIEKSNHKYIKTIVLPGRHHMGGIAYDNIHKNIWISCYDERAQANVITLRQLESYDYKKSYKPIEFEAVNDLYTIPKDSFMAYYKGYLYIGYFQIDNNSILQKFKIKKNGQMRLTSSASYQQTYDVDMPSKIAVPVNVSTISSRVQGLAFSQYRMYITESYGIMPSKLAVFNIKDDDDIDQKYVNGNAISVINLPQKLEQIAIQGGDMYSIYESGAYAYRYYSFPVIDRVICMRLPEVNRFGQKSD